MAHREDETEIYNKVNEKFNYDITYESERLTIDNIDKVKGYEAVAVNAVKVDGAMCEKLHEYGVKYLLTKSAGVDHIDLAATKKYGIFCANVPSYSPSAISEHTVMLILMLIRKMKLQMKQIKEQYYMLEGLRGRQISSMTIGIIGTGRIGTTTIRILSGFGGKILAYDKYENDKVKQYAEYVDMDKLLSEADIIVLHCPLFDDNVHMIDSEQIDRMKNGVILVNTARGELVNTEAVYDALVKGKISAFGMDVYEKENLTQRKDYRGKKLDDELLSKLVDMDQVIFTTHTAFYTDEAIEGIAKTTLQNLADFINEGKCVNQK